MLGQLLDKIYFTMTLSLSILQICQIWRPLRVGEASARKDRLLRFPGGDGKKQGCLGRKGCWLVWAPWPARSYAVHPRWGRRKRGENWRQLENSFSLLVNMFAPQKMMGHFGHFSKDLLPYLHLSPYLFWTLASSKSWLPWGVLGLQKWMFTPQFIQPKVLHQVEVL